MKRMRGSEIGKKVVCTTMSALVALMMLPAAAWAEAGEGARDGTVAGASLVAYQAPSLFAADDGYDIGWYLDDPSSPEFGLATPAQLRGLSALVNGTAQDGDTLLDPVSFEGKVIYQEGAISLAAGTFTPIGTPEHPFAGTYDGQDMNITSLRVDGVTTYAGLFGYVAETGALRNIALENGRLSVNAQGEPATAAAGDALAGGIFVSTDSEYVGCVGSLAGQCDGTVENCSSDVAVTVSTTMDATAEHPYTVQRVGGLVGYARADMTGCSYVGTVNVQVDSDTLNADTSSDSLRVADSIGGVVGRFGDPDRHGTLRECWNEGDVIAQSHGAGAFDRFGVATYACPFFVGGVVGYSNGSVYDCHNGAYNVDTQVVTGRVLTGVFKSGASGELMDNRGADQVGGVVGALRSVSDVPGKYNDGDPDDPVVVQGCYNEAQVTGLCGVGGIVGETGVYCTVTQCYNGTISDMSDWTRNQIAGKVVSTRWNKPMTGGIAGHLWSSDVTYCANYAEIRNVQTGYYTAGIAGCQFVSDDYPNVTGEIYACFNSGGVYTVNTVEGVEYREAGILGQNEGYVHDCIVMKGSVPYHQITMEGYEDKQDAPIGANDWGAYDNLVVRTPNELASSESAAWLNAIAAQTGDWSRYWFINRAGYPVLNTWVNLADSERTLLTSSLIASAEQVAPAPWMGEGSASVPTLKVTLTDGTVLVQNADFLVVPQAGAWEMSTGGAYRAGITGIGVYRGTVANCARYDIGACDLSLASTYVSPMKYAFGRVVFPEQATATMGGVPISSDELDYVIYNSATSAASVRDGRTVFPVYDSAGYISYTADGAVKQPVSEIEGGLAGLNAEMRDWWLYDRNYDLISDSAGNSYYPSTSGSSAGKLYGANTSCVNLKSGSPSGYVVQFMPHAGSASVTGSIIGYYVIEPVNLYRDCTFQGVALGERTWQWDPDKAMFYTEDGADAGSAGSQEGSEGDGGAAADGNGGDGGTGEGEGAGAVDGERAYGMAVTFTGQSIEPVPSIAYGDYALVQGSDFRVIYGDPDPADGGSTSSTGVPNRNVTVAAGSSAGAAEGGNGSASGDNGEGEGAGSQSANGGDEGNGNGDGTGNAGNAESAETGDDGSDPATPVERAGMTVLPMNTSNMSNYIVAYFDIVPAAFEQCEVSLAAEEWAYTGEEVRPPVTVTLDGVTLQEGIDYEVAYANNIEKGEATYTVTPLANLSGGELQQASGTFRIIDGVDISEAFTLGAIADQQFNWGYDVHPQLAFEPVGGEPAGDGPEGDAGAGSEGSGGEGSDPDPGPDPDPDPATALVEGVDYTVAYSKNTITKWPNNTAVEPVTVTVMGTGKYTGELQGTFHIVPYDAAANATGQLRAYLQDVSYGMWGSVATATVKDKATGVSYPRDATVNVGSTYPVMLVQARPIVDWAAYDAALADWGTRDAAIAAGVDFEAAGCYGEPITMSTSNDNVNGGLINRYPARYYENYGTAEQVEVNGNGAVYSDAQSNVFAQPRIAETGEVTATVELRCGTSGNKGGAVGVFECGTFTYGGTSPLSSVAWSVGGTCVYNGAEQRPVTGATQSGIALVEGQDYTIAYSENDSLVNPGTVHYAVTAIEGEGKHFTGTFYGAFSIMPLNLSTAADVQVTCEERVLVDDLAAGVFPVPEVRAGGMLLVEGVDYTLSYLNNHEEGTATVFANGMGNCTGAASAQFTIVEAANMNTCEVSGLDDATWTGAAIKRVPTVVHGPFTLEEGVDYTVAYLRDGKPTTDFTSVGTITVRLTGAGDAYMGTHDVEYRIVARDLAASTCTATLSSSSYTYTGAVLKPTVSAKFGLEGLAEGTDYTLSWSNASSKMPGTYTVTLTGKGGYAGTKTLTYTIAARDLSGALGSLSGSAYTYNGSVQRPSFALKLGSTTLVEGTDYTLTWSNGASKMPGTYQVTIAGTGGYAGKKTLSYTIAARDFTKCTAALSATKLAYAGAALKPSVKAVSYGTAALVEGADYTVKWSNASSKLPGTYQVTLTGKGGYTGTKTLTYTISARQLSGATVTMSAAKYTYNGKVQKPAISVKYGTSAMKAGTDYTVKWSNASSKLPGTYKVTLAGKGGYAGSRTLTYTVSARSLSKATVKLSKTKLSYTGKVLKPKVTAKYGSTALKAGADYTLKWSASSPKNPGTYKVTLTGKGGYKGSATKSYQIVKAANALTVKAVKATQKVKAGKEASIAPAKAWKVTKNKSKGEVTYKKTSGNMKIVVAKNGKVTVKKGLAKGSYTVKVKATSAATVGYKAASKTVTLKVKVA